MRLARGLALTLLFFLDVHVKAAEVSTCWGLSTPCAMAAHADKLLLKHHSDWRLSLAPYALVEQRNENLIELISGRFYVETSTAENFKTPYGQVWCENTCKALMERSITTFTIKSLEGRWLVRRTGEEQIYVLAPGLQLRLSEVTDSGQADMEFPQSLPWLPTVSAWATLYPGNTQEFKATVAKFRDVWREAVEAVSQMHQQVVTRTLASANLAQAQIEPD